MARQRGHPRDKTYDEKSAATFLIKKHRIIQGTIINTQYAYVGGCRDGVIPNMCYLLSEKNTHTHTHTSRMNVKKVHMYN